MTRTLLVAVATAMLLAPPAFAADLAVPHIYTKAPPVAVDPGYNWSGFYAGINVGYGWGRSATTADFVDSGGGALLNSSAGKFDLNGVTGGGQIGYNWQREMFVVGFEADFQGSGRKGRFDALCAGAPAGLQDGVCTPGHRGDNTFDPALPVTFNLVQKVDWFGTIRGRLGVAVTPRVLFYGTGGLAYGRVSTSGSVDRDQCQRQPWEPTTTWRSRPLRQISAAARRRSAGPQAPASKAPSPTIGAPGSNISMSISEPSRVRSQRQ